MLIIFAGLPGSGKTTLARALAAEMDLTYLRIDSIETVIKNAGNILATIEDTGYRIAAAVALDNLRASRTVIVDSVNPIGLTRTLWWGLAHAARSPYADVEVICSDAAEHKARVETRTTDLSGLDLPTWQQVLDREYHPWTTPRIVIDTAHRDVDACTRELIQRLSENTGFEDDDD